MKDFYKSKGIILDKLHFPTRDAVDIEFDSKEALIKAIDAGTGTIDGYQFCIRSSI